MLLAARFHLVSPSRLIVFVPHKLSFTFAFTGAVVEGEVEEEPKYTDLRLPKSNSG